MISRLVQTLLVVAALVSTTITAHAATVETKVRAILRDKPNSASRIVERVPVGKKLQVLGKTGNWVHVRSGKVEGWVAEAELKGDDDDGGDQPAEGEPLAKGRNVRPEVWVNKSRYHEGDDEKLVVSVSKAELYGRPASTGAVIGILRRGEQVTQVKRSADKAWVNIDIGGGETAWIEARAVKPGKLQQVTGTPEESETSEEAQSAPQTTPGDARKRGKMVKNEPTPSPVDRAQPAPPTRGDGERSSSSSSSSGGGGTQGPATARNEGPTPGGNDQPPEEPGKKRKVVSRYESAAALAAGEAGVARDAWTAHGKLYVTPSVRAGLAILQQKFTSNGSGSLSNYETSTNAFGAMAGIGLWGTIGRYFLLGGDAGYTFAGAAQLRYTGSDGNAVLLGIQAHTIDAGLSGGVHFKAVGGLSVRLRIGGELQLNTIEANAKAPLPSDRVVGMTIGLAANLPALFYLAHRPFGVQLFGGGLVPAVRDQTSGLQDGQSSSTYGAYFGGGFAYALLPAMKTNYRGALTLEATYNYGFAVTHYTGPSKRNTTITVADRGSAQHIIALGLGYSY